MANFELAIFQENDFRNSCSGLFSKYAEDLQKIKLVAQAVDGQESVITYFAQGNSPNDSFRMSSLFELDGAIKALNASYWQKAITLTGALELMPAKKREEWHEKIRKLETPEFESESVLSTVENILLSRRDFFTDKVDGVFRSLSGTHVTNSPSGFTQRFIISGVINPKFLSPGHYKEEILGDLREIICQVNNLPKARNFHSLIWDVCQSKEFGKWISYDGGLFRIKFFKSGTAHVEVDKMTALKLNTLLANKYPMAIPSKFRFQNTEYKKTDIPLELIDIKTVHCLSDYLRRASDGQVYYGELNKEAVEVLKILGAMFVKGYPKMEKIPVKTLREICRTRVSVNIKENQYYPTKKNLAEMMVDLLNVESNSKILEPSSGQGALVEAVLREVRTEVTSIEINELNASMQEDKGLPRPLVMDFLDFDENQKFDRVIMNPPFSKGRAETHLKKAFGHLKPGGVLVACLPSTFKDKVFFKGHCHDYSKVYRDEFDGTGVSVVILTLHRNLE